MLDLPPNSPNMGGETHETRGTLSSLSRIWLTRENSDRCGLKKKKCPFSITRTTARNGQYPYTYGFFSSRRSIAPKDALFTARRHVLHRTWPATSNFTLKTLPSVTDTRTTMNHTHHRGYPSVTQPFFFLFDFFAASAPERGPLDENRGSRLRLVDAQCRR